MRTEGPDAKTGGRGDVALPVIDEQGLFRTEAFRFQHM